MSRHRELKVERSGLQSEIEGLRNKISGYQNFIKVQESLLNNLDKEKEEQIKKTSAIELNKEIDKQTFKHREILRKLQNKRDEIISNRDKKLESITYENYSKKAKKKLSIDDSVKKSEEIKSILDEKMGKRFSRELSRIIPSTKSFNSLSEIQEAFGEVESMCSNLKGSSDIMGRLELMVFSYDTSDVDSSTMITVGVVSVVLLLIGIFFMPLLVVFLVTLVVMNVMKSIQFYKAMSIVKVLVSNVKKINQSIEDGIRNRVKSKRTEVENKFKLMLSGVEEKIATVEELISDTTQEVTNDFTFDDREIVDSFKTKKDSYLEQIKNNEINIQDANSSIKLLEEKISKIDLMIAEEGKNIFETYYPRNGEFENKSSVYLDDFLVDIVNDEPVVHELPRGSAVYFYKDESVMLNFLNLYLVSLYTRMQPTSLYVKLIDQKYACTGFIDYNKISTMEQIIDKDASKTLSETLNKEMMKRIKIIGSKHIDDYNKAMLEDNSSPQPYYYVFDLFNKPNDGDTLLRQVLINGFKYGLAYNLFLDVKDVEGDAKCVEFLEKNYSSYYYITDSGVSKKSSKFLSIFLKDK